jgi:RND family efflux transporter MFP subunit
MYKSVTVLLLITVLALGCNTGQKSKQSAENHQHVDEVSQYTLFSEHLEFFIEHEPLEAGKESNFLVHLTSLNTYKPIETGHISIHIDGVSVTSGLPQEPGIFKVPFMPKKAGAFHASYSYQSEEFNESAEEHVHIYQDHADLHSDDGSAGGHSHGSEAEGEISFLKEQAWNSDFMVSELRMAAFSSVIPTSGEILAMPGEKKNVASNGRGMVLFASRNLVQGSPVTQGEHLFTISSENMLENNIELQYQEYQNSYEKSKSEYLRHKKLYTQGAISERQYIDTRASYQADSLRFYNLKANTTSEGLKVVSPVTGTIHEMNVSDGQFVDVGEIMVIISSNRTLLIRADLGQQHFDQLEDIHTANFRPAYSEEVYSVEEFGGRLLATGSSVAENDHYLPVMFEVTNDGRILEGAFTEVFLKTTRKDSCLVLPQTALTEEQGAYYAYIQRSGESYSKIAVNTGNQDGRFVEITGGLDPGDRVVTVGVMLLKAASQVSGVADHGHSH